MWIRIELCMANLVSKTLPKVVRTPKYNQIFMNFEAKNFIVRNDANK